MTTLTRHRALLELGKRAVDYYLDTGFCVFCDADDCTGKPHEEHCNVGELAGVVVTPERVAEKRWQREILAKHFAGTLTHEELHAPRPVP